MAGCAPGANALPCASMTARRPRGGLLHEVRAELRRFARDPAGRRFLRHHERAARKRTLLRTVVRMTLGTIATAAGVVMWFVPGPGWLFVFFGMALFAGESRWLAGGLDRFELFARAQGHQAQRAWRDASLAARAALLAGVGAISIGATAAAAWLVWGG